MFQLSRCRLVPLTIFLFVTACNSPVNVSQVNDTVAPIASDSQIWLDDWSGYSFFDVMTSNGGIKDALDRDYRTPFEITDTRQVLGSLDHFTPKVGRKLMRSFGSQGERGLKDLVDDLEGDRLTPPQLKRNLSRRGLVPWTIADYLALASGASTLVWINDQNYYYNVSYEPDEVKSGRSFGAGPNHKADDASYPFYLKELDDHLDHSSDSLLFYERLLELLIDSDISRVDELNDYGQTLLTDFVTIYTAELYRHIIAGLGRRAPWENDLAEVTFLSLWNHEVGLIQEEGELVVGTARDWNGFGPRGSGVGITRSDRRSLQKKVCNAVRELKPGLVEAMEEYIDRDRDDCYRALMEQLNNFSAQGTVEHNDTRLIKAVVEFLSFTKSHAREILDQIQ